MKGIARLRLWNWTGLHKACFELALHVAVDLSIKELLNAHPKPFQSSPVRNHRDRAGVRCLRLSLLLL